MARRLGSRATLATVIAILGLLLPQRAPGQDTGDKWHFTAGLDLWAPTVNGKLKYAPPPTGGSGPVVEVRPHDYLSHIEAVVPVFAEARKGKLSVFADVLYLSPTSEKTTSLIGGGAIVPLTTSSTVKGLVWMLVGGYAVADGPAGTLDVIGGLRYFGCRVKTKSQFNVVGLGGGIVTITSTISGRQDFWNGVAGIKGRVKFGEHWFLPYYADVGGGTSSLTYQLVGGVAYAWRWANAGLVFHHLFYDQKDDKLIQNMRFSGPGLYVAFRL